jgi:hypothetical protein
MHLQSFEAVPGRVLIIGKDGPDAGGGDKPLPPITVRLVPKYRFAWTGEGLVATSRENGEFRIPAAMLDDYWVTVSRLPDGYYVKSVEAAGREIYGSGFRPEGAALTVTLGTDGPAFSGKVADREGRPQPDAAVVLLAASPETELAPSQIRTAMADSSGRFQFNGVSPGDYYVAALRRVPADEVTGPRAIQFVRQSATRVSLRPGTQREATLEPRELPRSW